MILPVGKGKRGFSLLELVLVLLLIGVSMADRAAQHRQGTPGTRGANLGSRLGGGRARSEEPGFIRRRMPQQLVINLPQNSYRVARSREVRLPGEVRFISVEGGEAVDRDSKRFYFYPNGSGLGGEIVLADGEKSISYLIRLEALTGRIEVARAN